MKKIIFLLLVTIASYGQTYQNPTYGTITTKTAPTTTADPYVSTISSNGVIGKVAPENIPVNVIPPTIHYTPTTPTLKGHFQGLDNAIGNIPLTTAGNTTRVWFTGDATTITAGTFYLTNPANKGTVANVSQSVINDDNQKKYFTQDLIGQPFATATLFPPGVYAGNLSASTTPNSAQQRFTVELYKCNNSGTPIASGVYGAPVGDLGVTVILILDSGLLTLADGSVTNVPVSASLASQFSIAVGERIRYHVSAEKVGTASSNITESVWYGSSFNSFLDVPTPITSSGVSNVSTVTGVTVTNALDNLQTAKADLAGATFTGAVNVPTPTLSGHAVTKGYADGLVVGLLDDRGTYNASSNLFPTTGGSGTGGAIVKGDIWYVGTAGTLGGKAVAIGDSFRALVDSPGQTAGNWSLLSSNLGYVPANDANVLHTTGNEIKTGVLTLNPAVSATSALARGTYLNPALTATANNDMLIGLDIAPNFINGVFTGVQGLAIRGIVNTSNNSSVALFRNTNSASQSSIAAGDDTGTKFVEIGIGNSAITSGSTYGSIGEGYLRASPSASGLMLSSVSGNIRFVTGVSGIEKARIFGSDGNLILQNGGTFTNAGYRLDVFGNIRTNGTITYSTPPATSAGTYDILTRNTSTGVVEKVASSSILTGSGTNTQVSFWTGTNTQSGDGTFIWNNTQKILSINGSGDGGIYISTQAGTSPLTTAMYSDTVSDSAGQIGVRYGGTKAAPTATAISSAITGIYGAGYDGTTTGTNSGAIRILAADNFTSTSQPTHIDFATTPAGSTSRTERFRINSDGQIKITTTPTTSAGTYDILTRNTSTGFIEKVASNTYATIASPAFTGTPTAPTATAGTNTTQIATTAFVRTATSALGSSGSYTPTITGVSNTGFISAVVAYYTVVNKIVTVSVNCQITASVTATDTTVHISLPFNMISGLTGVTLGSGTGLNSGLSSVANLKCVDTTKLIATYKSVNTNTTDFNFTFMYQIP